MLNKEELKSTIVMQSCWLTSIYTLSPIILTGLVSTKENTILIARYRTLELLAGVIVREVCSGMMYNKNRMQGLKLLTLIAIVVSIPVSVFADEGYLLAYIVFMTDLILIFTDKYTHIEKVEQRVIADTWKSISYPILLVVIYYFNPFNSIVKSFFLVRAIASLLQLTVEVLLICRKELTAYALEKFSFKDEISLLKSAISINRDRLLSVSINYLSFHFMYKSKNTSRDILVMIAILKAIPNTSVMVTMQQEYRRAFLNNITTINFKKVHFFNFIITVLVSALIFYISAYTQFKTFNFFTMDIVIMCVSYIIILYIEPIVLVREEIFRLNRNMGLITWLSVFQSISTATFRAFASSKQYLYIIIVSILCVKCILYSRTLRRNNYFNIDKGRLL